MKCARLWAVVAALAMIAAPVLAQTRGTANIDALRLLAYPEVQKELKLSPAQTKKIEAARKDWQQRMLQVIRGATKMSMEERRKKFDSLRDDQDRELVELLDVKQRQRLRQIEVQQMGTHALLRDDVAAEVSLTDGQRDKLRGLSVAENEEIRHMMSTLGTASKPTASESDAARQKVERVRQETGDKMVAILTPAQRKRFQEMQGAPFHLSPVAGGSAHSVAP